jgi:hypothetical protein
MSSTKTCPRCKTTKPLLQEFWAVDARTSTKFQSWCRVCKNAHGKSTQYGRYRKFIDHEGLQRLRSETTGCVICGHEGGLCVDHCHKTHKIRGMLCQRCNKGLGLFKDDPELLEFAATYVRALG